MADDMASSYGCQDDGQMSDFDPYAVCNDDGLHQQSSFAVAAFDSAGGAGTQGGVAPSSPCSSAPSGLAAFGQSMPVSGMGWSQGVGAAMEAPGRFAHDRGFGQAEYNNGHLPSSLTDSARFLLHGEPDARSAPFLCPPAQPLEASTTAGAPIYPRQSAQSTDTRNLSPGQLLSSNYQAPITGYLGEQGLQFQHPPVNVPVEDFSRFAQGSMMSSSSGVSADFTESSPSSQAMDHTASDADQTPSSSRANSSNSYMPFPNVIVERNIILGDGTRVSIDVFARVVKNVFIPNQEKPTWTCYRRNYLSIECSYTLDPCIEGSKLYLQDLQWSEPKRIQALSISLAATADHAKGKSIELIQHTPKRDKGPRTDLSFEKLSPSSSRQQGNLGPYSTNRVAMPDLPFQMDAVEAQTGVSRPDPKQTGHTLERIQFKTATANNGKRRAQQQHFHLVLRACGDIRKSQSDEPQWVEIAMAVSMPLIVRGRSPGHYGKDDKRGGSGGNSGSGSNGRIRKSSRSSKSSSAKSSSRTTPGPRTYGLGSPRRSHSASHPARKKNATNTSAPHKTSSIFCNGRQAEQKGALLPVDEDTAMFDEASMINFSGNDFPLPRDSGRLEDTRELSSYHYGLKTEPVFDGSNTMPSMPAVDHFMRTDTAQGISHTMLPGTHYNNHYGSYSSYP